MQKNKKEDRQLKREIKEQVYTKYTDITDSLMKKDYYKGFKSTLSTFLALNMCAEATKKNLIKMGADRKEIESVRRTTIEEIWQLMDLYEKGIFQQLVQQHELEQEQAKKK